VTSVAEPRSARSYRQIQPPYPTSPSPRSWPGSHAMVRGGANSVTRLAL
jgi:hypothetical protein